MASVSNAEDITTDLPDLRDIPADRLAEIGGTALEHAIRLYRERLEGNDAPQRSFNSGI